MLLYIKLRGFTVGQLFVKATIRNFHVPPDRELNPGPQKFDCCVIMESIIFQVHVKPTVILLVNQ